MKTAYDIAGESAALIGFLGAGYVVGYLASTILFYIRERVRWLKSQEIESIRPEIIGKLKEIFGDWIEKENKRYLAGVCLNYVELNIPDYYYEKIERRTSLRNFEMGIAAVILTIGISQIVWLQEWRKIIAILPIFGSFAMMLSSRKLEAAIDRITFITYYTVAISDSNRKKTVIEKEKD